MKIKNRLIKLIISSLIIIIGAYFLSIKFLRFDLTSEGRYTLSDYSINILKNLNDKVYIKVYLDGKGLPSTFKNFRREIKEELDEFKIYAGENLEFEFINPSESPDQEVRFALYGDLFKKGLIPIETNEISDDGKSSQKLIFPGIILSYKGREKAVNLLKSSGNSEPESEENINNSIQALEYEFTNAIQKLSKEKKPKIAFLEGHGELNEFQLMDISSILSEYYKVMTGALNGTPGILNDFKAVIIAKPENEFSEQDKFVIDQYIMKGGSVLWLIEGCKTNVDSLLLTGSTISLAQDLNLNDMLFQYGARINHDLLQDKFYSPIGLTIKGPDGKPKINYYPWYYFPVIVSDNNHVISKYLNYIRTEFISTIDTVGFNPNIKKTILLKSSELSRLDPIPARIALEQINNMPADNEMKAGRRNLAVLLEGKFESVFKNRPVNKYFPGISLPDVLTESKPAKMIIVSDGDIIRNEVDKEGKPSPLGFDRYTRQTFTGNKEFILNAVNYLCDDEGLMSIRSRELKMRLLNHDKIINNRFIIQFINIVFPVLLILLFGIIVSVVRKRKYKN
ncbi:MAG: gliding motility-associated ABC transporter substrate-binding protein GldG [Bacteroidales bacterium]|nr:gliding motility-associated ABC transporter substrate-binding protein GldG [Bacteroidales bacterium]